MANTKKFSEDEVFKLNKDFENSTPLEVLSWALGNLQPQVALASSFSIEDIVLTDMMLKINPQARVFSLDTGRLNQETYDLMDKVRAKYGLRLEIYFPDAQETEKMVRENGLNLFYESIEKRRLCCQIRKVHPLNRALSGLSAWITGLRTEQAVTRKDLPKLEIDKAHNNILKINPLLKWTSKDVWNYIKKNNLPYNILHDQGYPSIGCEPCTRAVKPGEDERAGRWWWETPEEKECGLHK